MKKMLIGLFALMSLSAFADSLTGLNCSTDYIIHEVRRTPYETSRVIARKSLLGGYGVLGFTKINNEVTDFKEEFSLVDSNDAVTYSLDVQEKETVLSVKLHSNKVETVLIDRYQFHTKEGFSRRISLGSLLELGSQQVVYAVLTCLPVYR
jgi:hypothetical protein